MADGKRIAIVGAGPIGLEAALCATERGFDVRVYERGRAGEHLRRWGHVRLFTPFGTNVSPWGREVLAATHALPADDALLTGREFVASYLAPLASLPRVRDCLEEHVEVLSIGRPTHGKQHAIGQPVRAEQGFRLLLRDGGGERMATADFVLDCSGTFAQPRWMGPGGCPATGERALAESGRATYTLPDVFGADRARFAGKRTLVVGSGYSAATAVVSLGEVAESEPHTRVWWVTRPGAEPLARIEDDALPERDALARRANALASDADSPVTWLPERTVESLVETGEGAIEVRLSALGGAGESLTVDELIANVGFKPDRALYEELQFHECYASQGPMKLAAALLGETSADCLRQSGHGAETLLNPEPDFFVLGSKSYGRDSRFLLRTGIQQVQDVMELIGRSAGTP